MTGPFDEGPSGIFDHLDDPGAPAPSQDVLSTVVRRGRRIRARRQGTIAMSGAAAVALAVIGGLGISHAVDAGPNDRVLAPADSPTPSVSATAAPHHSHRPGESVVVPEGQPASNPASPTMPPSAQPCATEVPSSSPSPLVNGPIVESSVPPLLPTAAPDGCTSESPSPTPSATETASPEPTTTNQPSTSPSPEPTAS